MHTLRYRSLGIYRSRAKGSMQRRGGGASRRGAAYLRCEVVLLQELDDLRVAVLLGGVQRRLVILRWGGGKWRGLCPAREESVSGGCMGRRAPPAQAHS
eukprot:scaffold99828_cov63-Phaeocystis_antarctica.AAC.2